MKRETIKVISEDTGLPVGTELVFDEDKELYVYKANDTEIGDGYEAETQKVFYFNAEYVDEHIGVYFEVKGEKPLEKKESSLSDLRATYNKGYRAGYKQGINAALENPFLYDLQKRKYFL
jgi:hypothetical protein